MDSGGGNFNKNLKESKNIAIIADASKGLDSLCASIALKELVREFLDTNVGGFSVDTFYLEKFPTGSKKIVKRANIKNKIGEKTLYITFPVDNVSKVTYDWEPKDKSFKVALVGVKNAIVNKEGVVFDEKSENFDMCIGVGFKNNSDFVSKVPFVKGVNKLFIFNKKNLKGDSLVSGIIELYFSENIKPNALASLAFFTFLSSTKANN